jgi:hypothetical protein
MPCVRFEKSEAVRGEGERERKLVFVRKAFIFST